MGRMRSWWRGDRLGRRGRRKPRSRDAFKLATDTFSSAMQGTTPKGGVRPCAGSNLGLGLVRTHLRLPGGILQAPFATDRAHNRACETAGQANCQCFCHGAGHQNDLVMRAARCDTTTDLAALQSDLERVFGGFHHHVRDVVTPTRGSRNVPDPNDIAKISTGVGRGATWYESLLVDEALHAIFIQVARQSLGESVSVRDAQTSLVNQITLGALGLVGMSSTLTNVVESHVWCSVMAEFLGRIEDPSLGPQESARFSAICYPRQTASRVPTGLAAVRLPALAHVDSSFRGAAALTTQRRMELMRLVAGATCPDPWHHPAVVRFALEPFVTEAGWPLAATTQVALVAQFADLRVRWRRKQHW